MGKAFYKGGFESKMTKKEASLILSLKYVFRPSIRADVAVQPFSLLQLPSGQVCVFFSVS